MLAADGLAPLCAYRWDVVLGGPDFTIVVGFDGSPRAEDALALGELLAVRGGARLMVVCVYVCRPVVSIESRHRALQRERGRSCVAAVDGNPVLFLHSRSSKVCSLPVSSTRTLRHGELARA